MRLFCFSERFLVFVGLLLNSSNWLSISSLSSCVFAIKLYSELAASLCIISIFVMSQLINPISWIAASSPPIPLSFNLGFLPFSMAYLDYVSCFCMFYRPCLSFVSKSSLMVKMRTERYLNLRSGSKQRSRRFIDCWRPLLVSEDRWWSIASLTSSKPSTRSVGRDMTYFWFKLFSVIPPIGKFYWSATGN